MIVEKFSGLASEVSSDEASSSSTQLDAQSICFPVKLFLIVLVDFLLTYSKHCYSDLLDRQVIECIEKTWCYGAVRTLTAKHLPQ